MTTSDRLSMLKVDLGIMATTAYDERLTQYLASSRAQLETNGVDFGDGDDITSIEDNQLIVLHAGWQWRRRTTGEGMPRMVQFMLHSRLIKQTGGQ